MRMLISGFSPTKELGTRANQKISGYNRVRLEGRKRFEYAACGRVNFRIRKTIFAEKKISGYVWTWPKPDGERTPPFLSNEHGDSRFLFFRHLLITI